MLCRGMIACGQNFSGATCAQIQETLNTEPGISRLELSRRVCDWLDWRSPNGRLQDMSCRKALNILHRHGSIDLPPVQRPFGFERSIAQPIDIQVPEFQGDLLQLGLISVEPITSRYCKDSKIWFSLLDRYHYLGSLMLCGAQIRYVVKSSIHGYLGALAFSSASWALRCRDQHIGWSEAARRNNLSHIVGNDRFLIVPTVSVANLASHVLSLALGRLVDDWQTRYNVRPVLVETFVDPTRFSGTCYKAANWIDIGKSAGRRDGTPKKVLIYPLCHDWREVLCTEPQIQLGETVRPETPAHWAEHEFGTIRLYDNRIKKRLYTIAQDFYAQPQASIPESCGSKARTMGAYRFFSNPKVTMDIVLTAHLETTLERIRTQRVVLAPQDTTTLTYTHHPMTEGLGPINNTRDQALGLLLHDTLAFSEEGTPLGVLDAQCWARDPDKKGQKNQRSDLPIEQKESMKWLRSFRKVAQVQKICPDTQLVSIGDRESDIYELLEEASKDPDGPGLLVRSAKSRKRKVDHTFLWDLMPNQRVAGSLKIHVPRSGSRKARDTWINVRFAQVKIKPPTKLTHSRPLDLWAVYVRERVTPQGFSPIVWMLLTTVPVNDFADARKRVEWYSGRWGIEVYHRTLKSGCRIKDRQLGTVERLENCLGIDMVVAWRVYHLTMLGRETPDLPCTAFFEEIEWKALCCYVNKTPIAPDKPPKMSEAVRMVGAMGGHLGRIRDGPPGTQKLWRGLQRLSTAAEMYAIFTQQENHHPLQSGP